MPGAPGSAPGSEWQVHAPAEPSAGRAAPDQVGSGAGCAHISAELARVHRDREHMAALCSALAEGGQTIPDLASRELGVERRY